LLAFCHLANEASDIEIVESIPTEFELFATLSAEEWRMIKNSHNEGRLLKAATESNPEQFKQFLESIIENYG